MKIIFQSFLMFTCRVQKSALTKCKSKQGIINLLFFLLICRWYASIHGGQWPPETRPSDLHSLPDAGAGEGVSHESLPHEATKDRNGPPTLPHRATDQDLVSESKNEAQKGDPGHQRAK